jgi:hypothetical protein
MYAFADYAELDETSPAKHDFLDGNVWAMASGTPAHA